MAFINLWNPTDTGLLVVMLTSYLLGVVHGITPDEHTWPITFSYAIGSYSSKRGMKAGLTFSGGFTLQRALLSEIAFFALAGIFMSASVDGISYIAVGIGMAFAGLYISRKGRVAHMHLLEKSLYKVFRIHRHKEHQEEGELSHMSNPVIDDEGKPIPLKLAFVHGLIAGFGFGAFALILYTVLAPAMPSPWLGFLPGLLFGLGTMTMQVIMGAGFGTWLTKSKNLSAKGLQVVSRGITRYVLTYGGIAFLLAGFLVLAFPNLNSISIVTGIKIHNLDSLGIGFFLVVIAVVVIGLIGYVKSMRLARKEGLVRGE
ncbi:MAG: hypothetical protein M1129_05965 [Candidatus Thermoplasmatota archaeon]|jgi:MFS family permease|nr:hypothetical protein [Candidatus Thermoplasmatota archaeon]MCL5955159.1 hypothetical protein [Candidatus Thermoplasmatota archaeon]